MVNKFPNKFTVLKSLSDFSVKYHAEREANGNTAYYLFNDVAHNNGIILRLTYTQSDEGCTYYIQPVYPMFRYTDPHKFTGRTTYEVHSPNSVGKLARTMLNSPKWYTNQRR